MFFNQVFPPSILDLMDFDVHWDPTRPIMLSYSSHLYARLLTAMSSLHAFHVQLLDFALYHAPDLTRPILDHQQDGRMLESPYITTPRVGPFAFAGLAQTRLVRSALAAVEHCF